MTKTTLQVSLNTRNELKRLLNKHKKSKKYRRIKTYEGLIRKLIREEKRKW